MTIIKKSNGPVFIVAPLKVVVGDECACPHRQWMRARRLVCVSGVARARRLIATDLPYTQAAHRYGARAAITAPLDREFVRAAPPRHSDRRMLIGLATSVLLLVASRAGAQLAHAS
jgi:hypothetical protein